MSPLYWVNVSNKKGCNVKHTTHPHENAAPLYNASHFLSLSDKAFTKANTFLESTKVTFHSSDGPTKG